MKARCSGSLAARKSAVGVSRIRSLYAIVTTLLLLQLYACQGFTRTVLTNYNRCNKLGNTYYRDGSLVTYSTSSDSSNNEQPKKRRVLPFRFKNNKQGNINGVNSSNSNGNNKRRFPNPLKKFTTFLRSLSRTRRILFLQSLFIFALFSSSAVVSSIRTPIGSAKRPIEVSYSKFLKIVENQDKVGTFIDQDVRIPYLYDLKIGDRISYKLAKDAPTEAPPVVVPKKRFQFKRATTTSPLFVYTRAVRASPELVSTLREQKLDFSAAPVPKASALAVTIRTVMLGFYFVILFRLYKSISKGAGGGSGDVPGKLAQKSGDLPLASFEDIQGIDVAKNEVMELVDTLRNPQKYAILGARAPTGLLLEGPPGTGKTMLARATAASAGVPLLYCSGSDFVEMFVGRGAARVRKLFERASKLSPCIIFIDELDALGKARDSGNSFGGGAFGRSNDEAEQTLNQLLACMDGLDSSRRICVLAATNRREVLDPALVRPGRFDRIVALKLPDTKGRENILRVHTSKLPGFNEGTGIANDRPNALGIGRQVDLSAVAAATEGLSGAELEFVVNEAAIRAVRRVSAALRKDNVNTDTITPHVEAKDFEEAVATFYSTRKGRQQPPWRTVFKQ